MSVINGEIWWDPTPGVLSYAVTITPSLGGSAVFTGATPKNYINTTSLPLTNGTNYDVNIVATCPSGSTTTNTLSLYVNSDGSFMSSSNYFFADFINSMSWGAITNVATDTGTSIACSIAPSQTGILIDPGVIVTSSGGAAPLIMPMWYTNRLFITIQNISLVAQVSNFYCNRNSVIETWSSRLVIAPGTSRVIPVSMLKPPQNLDSLLFGFT